MYNLNIVCFVQCKSLGVNTEIGSHAEHMVKKLGFDSFMEVSAKENYQVEALFQRAIDLVRYVHYDTYFVEMYHKSVLICIKW